MSDNLLITAFLPIALAVVMMGLGLHLTPADFRRVASAPKATMLALAVQGLLLPPVAFLLAWLSGLPGELALGLVLLAASPGGVTANLFSHLARGDVALNISLTAINSLLALLTLPLWAALAMSSFLGAESAVPPPTGKIVEVALLVIIPVALGMAVRAWQPLLADAAERPVRLLSSLVLAALIVLAMISEWELLLRYLPVVGIACVSFNVISLVAGYGLSRAARLSRPQATAIAFEVGIHNGTLAIYIALQVLELASAAVPAAVYSVSMYLTAGVLVWWLLRQPASPQP
jgi:BASS family bile acid:Na+ symporter